MAFRTSDVSFTCHSASSWRRQVCKHHKTLSECSFKFISFLDSHSFAFIPYPYSYLYPSSRYSIAMDNPGKPSPSIHPQPSTISPSTSFQSRKSPALSAPLPRAPPNSKKLPSTATSSPTPPSRTPFAASRPFPGAPYPSRPTSTPGGPSWESTGGTAR